ncbi:hypothetical protein HRUBRA_00179 [Pseudohaliea rubra DSM 19751]|uniref:Uncharacterized protein n=1 Tax=Pseudohaliea rubra DSM 19751 TaxID=1265313 RepID=A0A095X2Y8_9GAMM|nr:hypothetical protein HRUBRA_00179 [Pseudohaliea rubra DSM 19751]
MTLSYSNVSEACGELKFGRDTAGDGSVLADGEEVITAACSNQCR